MTVLAASCFDPLQLPLSGELLIEASAGTGKTWTIGILYLRLLLGLASNNALQRPLTVEEILVVTFTEAATKELRGRIFANIHALRRACVHGSSDSPVHQALLAAIPDNNKALSLLLAAERQADEAAIYTIHGFCQRMLTHNAFESGSLFEQTLLEDELPLRRQAVADFWRRHCYGLPLPIARMVSLEWSGPQALLQDISPWLQGEAPRLLQTNDANVTIADCGHQIMQLTDEVKTQWRAMADELAALITQSGVDKRSYSAKNLPHWLEKVTAWAATDDYRFPRELEKFRQSVLLEKTIKTAKTNTGQAPEHALFIAIERLTEQPQRLRALIIARAMSEIRASIQQEKSRRAELSFDDLLTRLDVALQQADSDRLAQAIRRRYPVAMVDEFQDTDPQQYRIFHTLYANQPDCALLLIGDPKQAIYAFRGADVFTYMKARTEVNARYTLETNWRSSPAMIAAVNQLFHQADNPFLFAQIPFTAAQPAEKNARLAFRMNGQTQPALTFWLHPGEIVSVSDYQQTMARQCALEIRNWLHAGQQNCACIVDGDGDGDGDRDGDGDENGNGTRERAVQAADISILVRNRTEAALVRQALKDLAIPAVYLSGRDSVFETAEAQDLLWLLQAVLAPEQERALRQAMATGLLGLDALRLDELNHNEHARDRLADEFHGLRSHWQRRGILPMLRQLITRRHLAENWLASSGGERRLTDVLHLGELLQQAAAQLDGGYALVRWLARQIDQPRQHAENQQLRLESDRHLVQIVTIHKSKGLEYPLVWIPFAADYRNPPHRYSLYHDRHNFNALLDLSDNAESKILAEEERLAEDLRLLYVALTRAVCHCSLGIAPLIKGNRTKSGPSDLHQSALGWLVQRGLRGDAEYLASQLALLQDNTAIFSTEVQDKAVFVPRLIPPPPVAAKHFTRSVRNNWRVTSYSWLLQYGVQQAAGSTPAPDAPLSVHSFPRGAAAGTFLHHLLENQDKHPLTDEHWLAEQLLKQGLEKQWVTVLQQWLVTIMQTPLNATGVALAALLPQHKQAELQFYLPIDHLLQAPSLDSLIQKHDPLSARCPPLDFQDVQGMLKGFIDLVFQWQDKYYLLDYKSNVLGAGSHAYDRTAMEQAMVEHRYDLQYQLYTLALHRYLRHRLAEYDYQRHFGGVIYLFLRGVDARFPGNGIFTCLPQEKLISELDRLFSGKNSHATGS